MGSCYSITETQQLVVQTLTTEIVINGPQAMTYIGPLKKGTKQDAIILTEKQYIHIKNIKDGSIYMRQGPGKYFLRSFERPEPIAEAISLKPNEYIRIDNQQTGIIKIEKGEKIVFLLPFEVVASRTPSKMHAVDATHAILVRDIRNGNQALITEPQMFVPTPFQEIVAQQELIILKEFEVMVLVGPSGNFVFKHGWMKDEASFFLPPFHGILEHNWSTTSVRKKGAATHTAMETYTDEESFDRIDMRHRFMTYKFVARTYDNVEIVIDIVFGWQIQDVERMVNKTKNATNDICLIARSEIIEQVAKQPFRKFMQEVNAVVENAVLQADRKVYDERGIVVTSIQVEGFTCKNEDTERVLQETVQETTNKMNRVLKQETTNEVIRIEMEGKIREEELKKRVLEIQYEHEQIIAKTDGDANAKRVHTFLTSLGNELSLEQKLVIFNIMEKQEAIKELANGTGITLFCTPQDVNLNMAAFGSIDKNHEQMLRVMPPTVPATSQARPAAINSISNE